MDRYLHTCLMIDFYGQLLTKKQFEILDMYYNNDYSLAEIAEILNISRQAVSDNKNRAMDSLSKYEEMLHLVKRCKETNKSLISVLNYFETIDSTKMSNEEISKMKEAKEKLKHIIMEI